MSESKCRELKASEDYRLGDQHLNSQFCRSVRFLLEGLVVKNSVMVYVTGFVVLSPAATGYTEEKIDRYYHCERERCTILQKFDVATAYGRKIGKFPGNANATRKWANGITSCCEHTKLWGKTV